MDEAGWTAEKAFVRALLMQKACALRMQKACALQNECTQEDIRFCFEYASVVQNIWIGADWDVQPERPNFLRTLGYELASECELAMSLLAPVLLAAPSLAFAWTSLDLLAACLEIARKSHVDTDINNEHSQPPWKTQTLTLSGETICYFPWKLLTDTSHGSAFIVSISHLTSNDTVVNLPWGPLTDTPQGTGLLDYYARNAPKLHDPYLFASTLKDNYKYYRLPPWMKKTPWASFKSLQTMSLAYAHTRPDTDTSALITRGLPLRVQVLMLSASLLRGPRDCIPLEIGGLNETGTRKECVVSDDIRFKVSLPRLYFRYAREDWYKVWACGFGPL
ncbi:hypothetical protein DEU56DRAFT_983616 [Suillus clintonianus]|uniref:uncharacterized protein n=1 Tax=Suillus clintonianus TaxID=1904413 RepID=UPI001B877354|nr:uncharacterized protein DEU56DRAFT_983616 [Suillus clintonianus]KAG2124232.1 hypothetical protein DEU56DRAFT_983616 [Suillus clintonianus]